MEIISYVGAASSNRRSYSGFNFNAVRTAKYPRFKIPEISLPSIKIRVAHKEFLLWSVITLAAGLFVSGLVYKTVSYVQSYTGPVQLQVMGESEAEFLNTAMASFAMETGQDQFDENGNVLSEDGKILTPSSIGLGKPISYSTYKVKSGDTISSIAIKFGLTNISTLIAVNGIDNVRTLRAGQKLRIPNQDGLCHVVSKGESLNALSVKYHVSVEEILDANDLSSRDLVIGRELFIPGAKMDSSSLKKAMGELFISPIDAKYRLTSLFGRRADPFTGVPSNHTGVDMACPTGTPIKAAMSGKIVYVGWSNIFGNYVIINHGNGYQSLYGHMSKTLCRNGQQVGQGTRIGLVGSTGYSTGPHLHFTVYKNGKLVDPMALIKR